LSAYPICASNLLETRIRSIELSDSMLHGLTAIGLLRPCST